MEKFVKRSKSKTKDFGTPSRMGHDASSFYRRRMYNESRKRSPTTSGTFTPPSEVNIIHCTDSRNMYHLPDDSVHLMITSPPYNVGKQYEADLSLTEYKDLLRAVLRETYRVLVEGGRACVNIANVGRTPYIPLHAYVIEIAEECGFYMRGEVIWDKGSSAGISCAWGSWRSASNPVLRDIHEYVLIFCKSRFKRSPVQQSSVGAEEFLEATKSIWRIAAVSAKTIGHPAPFPLELPLRLISLYSYVGDIVLDPFMGSGTTAKAAQQLDRLYVGYEIHKPYVRLANKRLAQYSKTLF